MIPRDRWQLLLVVEDHVEYRIRNRLRRKKIQYWRMQGNADTARIPMLVITAIKITAQERAALDSNLGKIIHVVEKSTFNRSEFIAEVRRALLT